MNIRELRFVTAIGVMALCALTVVRGADAVGFRIATANLQEGARAETLRSWYAVPGVGTLAREAALPSALDFSSKDALTRQRDQLTDYLSVKPTASMQWLMLAGSRLLLGESKESVIAAYGLSVVTGPNENDVMIERAKFGLYLWSDLPPELKKREIDDLSLASITGEEVENVRKLLGSLSVESRDEILKALPKPRQTFFAPQS